MGLVHDDGVVFVEPGIALGFGQQNAVGDHFYVGIRIGGVLKTDFVAHRTAQILPQFLGDAGGGGDVEKRAVGVEDAGRDGQRWRRDAHPQHG